MQYEFFFVPLRGGEGEKDRGGRDEMTGGGGDSPRMTGEGARPPKGAFPPDLGECGEDGRLARRNRIEEGMRG